MEPEEFQKIIDEEELEVLNPEFNTHPHVYYKNLYRYTKNFAWGGIRVAGDDFEGAKVDLEKDGKIIASQETNFFGDFKFDGLEDGDYVAHVDADGKKKDIEFTIAGKSLNLEFTDMD